MIDIQKITEMYTNIEKESKKIFKNSHDLGLLTEFKAKILGMYFSKTYDYYFSKRLLQKYEDLTIEKTIKKILEEIEQNYGTLEKYTALRKVSKFDNWHTIYDHKTSERIIRVTIWCNPDAQLILELFNYIFDKNVKSENNEYFSVLYHEKTLNVKFTTKQLKTTFVEFIKERLDLVKRKEFSEEI